MRSIVRFRHVMVAVLALWILVLPAPARAQPLNLSDGNYASLSEYIVGTWKWERVEPRQTVQMRFDRGGGFFFHNMTTGLQHQGSFAVTGNQFHLTIVRSCENNGARCQDRAPPLVVNYNFTPSSAGVFMSNDERWERQAGR